MIRVLSSLIVLILLVSSPVQAQIVWDTANSTSVAFGVRTNTTLTAPASISDNNGLFVWIAGPTSISAPDGSWTLIDHLDHTSLEDAQLWIWWKRAASESGNYTFTHSAGASQGFIIRASGMQTSGDPIEFHTTNASTGESDTTVTGLTGTTTVNDSGVVISSGHWDDLGGITPPTGTTPTFSDFYDVGAASVSILYVAGGVWSSSGATGNKTYTAVAAWVCSMFSVKPQVSGVVGCKNGLLLMGAGC